MNIKPPLYFISACTKDMQDMSDQLVATDMLRQSLSMYGLNGKVVQGMYKYNPELTVILQSPYGHEETVDILTGIAMKHKQECIAVLYQQPFKMTMELVDIEGTVFKTMDDMVIAKSPVGLGNYTAIAEDIILYSEGDV